MFQQLQTLLEFKQVSPIEEDCEEQGLDIAKIDGTPVFHLTGFVSRCDHGAGRSTTDRQYTFINKRPCDLPKVIRVVNEVYHAFNRNQNPFLALNISLNKGMEYKQFSIQNAEANISDCMLSNLVFKITTRKIA